MIPKKLTKKVSKKMTIRLSNYQALSKEQIDKLATLLEEQFQKSTEIIKAAPTIDDAVIGIVDYEANLYREFNGQKQKIAHTFEELFKQVGGKL